MLDIVHTILLTYCSIYFNVVHIAHIARVFINCTFCQYCTKLLNIVSNCLILLVATLVVINCTYCQHCSKLLKIAQYITVFLGPSWAKCSLLLHRFLLLQCCQPLTVICSNHSFIKHHSALRPPAGRPATAPSRSTSRFLCLGIVERFTSGWSSTTLYQQTTATRPAYREPGMPNLLR